MTTGTAAVAIIPNPVSGPQPMPTISARASAKPDIQMIATFGVLNSGCVRPSARGARPLRAREEKKRVAAFAAAFEFATIELQIARNTRIQPVPQKTLPRLRHGSAPVACLTNPSKPAPNTHAYEH